jgi:hypothetical protein
MKRPFVKPGETRPYLSIHHMTDEARKRTQESDPGELIGPIAIENDESGTAIGKTKLPHWTPPSVRRFRSQ